MVASVNKTVLIGHLGGKPELRYTPDGTPVATVSVATTERWKDRATGELKGRTEWHRVQVWRANAEFVSAYLDTGAYVYVEGQNRTQKWEDKEGVTRYTTVVVGKIDPLERKASDGKPELPAAPDNLPDGHFDDDIPF